MTVRIPDHLAHFVDERVASGAVASRAELITYALDELMHHEERDHEIALVDELNARGESLYPDLDGLADWGANQPMDIE